MFFPSHTREDSLLPVDEKTSSKQEEKVLSNLFKAVNINYTSKKQTIKTNRTPKDEDQSRMISSKRWSLLRKKSIVGGEIRRVFRLPLLTDGCFLLEQFGFHARRGRLTRVLSVVAEINRWHVGWMRGKTMVGIETGEKITRMNQCSTSDALNRWLPKVLQIGEDHFTTIRVKSSGSFPIQWTDGWIVV